MALEQADLGLVPLDEARAKGGLPPAGPRRAATMTFTVALARLPRGRCASCNIRRVLFALEVVGLVQGAPRCAACMGLRG